MKTANYINHIALVIDASGSMTHLQNQVIAVADNQIKYLAQRSQELDQETRVTVYTFANKVECVAYDKDALRLPSLGSGYRPDGGTALVDATVKALSDLAQTATLYGDHAFLIYVLTDGEENASTLRSTALKERIDKLPENWTLAVFVPNQNGVFEAKRFGFPAQNISVWDTSARGIAEVGETMRKATDAYMTQRATGTRGSKNLFTLDAANLTKANVNRQLVKKTPDQYTAIPVRKEAQIHEVVEKFTRKPYVLGSAFYQLTKRETVQAQKSVAVREKASGNLYVGTHARTLLNLPDHEVKVTPADHDSFDIFIQSQSVNRKCLVGTVVVIP